MSRYVTYHPEQDWLLPPSIVDELGDGHLSMFIHRVVERLDLRQFEAAYSSDGRPAYPPQLMLKVWLYAYTQGITSSRRIEQRIHEDLGYRLLAGNPKPDHWTLNQFRKQHALALNDVFTQVVEAARQMGLGRLGRVAIDSTRVQANASPDRSDSIEGLRRERARIRQRVRRVPGLKQMRERMREPDARVAYQRRKALVEPVFGVLKQQRGMRQFRCRGLVGVAWNGRWRQPHST